MAISFEMIYYTAADDAVEIAVNIPRLTLAVGDEMRVVGHYHIRKDQKLAGASSFVDCIASYLGYRIRSENGQTILCYRCEVIGRMIS